MRKSIIAFYSGYNAKVIRYVYDYVFGATREAQLNEKQYGCVFIHINLNVT